MMTRAFLILWVLIGGVSMWDDARSQISGGGSNAVMSGTLDLTTVNSTYMVPIVNGQGVLGIDITGLTGSGASITTEGTVNSTLWSPMNMLVAGGGGALTNTLSNDASFRSNTSGKTWIRVRVTVAGTGTAAITSSLSTDSSLIAVTASLPGGNNQIGGVLVNNFPASQAVTGTFWQATQPVSGTFWQATQPVSGTFWQSVQPVSTPTCANAPTTQVSLGTTATQIVAARAGRYNVLVSPSANVTYYVGGSGVTASTGIPITGGGSFRYPSGLALYGVVASGTLTVGAMECY